MYHKGRKVVDIYGGCMDRGNVQPVTPATLSQIYSATKGAGALMVRRLSPGTRRCSRLREPRVPQP